MAVISGALLRWTRRWWRNAGALNTDTATARVKSASLRSVRAGLGAGRRGCQGPAVGRDVSVTGFDDLPPRAQGLTTVRQPIRDKGPADGQHAAGTCFDQRRVVLATPLIVRDSTGPAPCAGRNESRHGR